MKNKTINVAYLSHIDLNLFLFRLQLMKTMLEYNCDVYAFVPKGRFTTKFEKEGIKFVDYSVNRKSYNPFGAIMTIFNIARLLKKHKIDVVHSFTFKPNVFGSIAGKLAGVPVIINHVTGLGFVYTEQTYKIKMLRCLSDLLYKIAFTFSSFAIFQNNDDAMVLDKLYNKEKQRTIVSSGVNVTKFKPGIFSDNEIKKIKQSLSIKPEEIVITIISRLNRHKGIIEFLQAARKITEKRQDCFFMVVGWIDNGNPASFGPEFISQNEQQNIRFFGERDDIPELLSATDIYVLPSYREGTPRTVLEAMAMGKPVITTDVPGCRETIIDGESGILVPVKDADALEAAITELVNNSDKRKVMGRAARQRAELKFSDDVINNKIINIYRTLLEKKKLITNCN